MTTFGYVNIDIPEASYLADLGGIRSDLNDVIEFCRHCEDAFPLGTPFTAIQLEIYSIAILTKYARLFTTGVRKKLNEKFLEQLSNQHSAAHKHFMDWRDKHIAHSVNDYEENQVVGLYEIGKESGGIRDITIQASKVVGMNLSYLKQMRELAEELLKLVNIEINTEKTKIFPLVKNMDIKKEVEEGKSRVLVSPGPVSKPRKRK